MAGISSESLAAAQVKLEALLPGATLSLAEELFGILGLLDSDAGLLRALTDPAREASAKAALVSKLVHGKVSTDAEQFVASLVESRWRTPRDLGDALETLGATVVSAVAENKGPGLAGLEELENDLFRFNQVVAANHEVQRALQEPQASARARSELALKLVPGVGAEAKVLIKQAVTAPRGLRPSALVKRFMELVAARQQRWIAEVQSSRPLTLEQQKRLQSSLNGLYGRELKINVNVDPALLGGIRVTVGDEVVDSTVVTRLTELRRKLAV
ncbi:F0F1 ATP synthase subunit delta [Arthrobacter sp. NPDC097144]|jgi:F-type H+-transporting ATPase subunit delta|uniref:F0F1 ATP synthase subunit delta n=1 Tax=Arthrobacter sp. NPDC097144 TaxID=3363946 RepID=UPI00382F9D44